MVGGRRIAAHPRRQRGVAAGSLAETIGNTSIVVENDRATVYRRCWTMNLPAWYG
jgi:hypothetical protein